MSKKTTKTKPAITGYLGFVYGGLFKQGYTHVFCVEDDVEETFESFKKYYGDKVHGRYVDLTNGTVEENLAKFFQKKGDLRIKKYMLMEATMTNLLKVIKEIAGVDKAHFLGFDDGEGNAEEAEEVAAKAKAPVKASAKTPVKAPVKKPAKKEEVEETEESEEAGDDDDDDESGGEEDETEEAEEEKPKKTAKKPAAKKSNKEKEVEKPKKPAAKKK
jgi:hypothetical protein